MTCLCYKFNSEQVEGSPVEAGRVSGGGWQELGRVEKMELVWKQAKPPSLLPFVSTMFEDGSHFFWATVTDNHIKAINKHAFLFSFCNSEKRRRKEQKTGDKKLYPPPFFCSMARESELAYAQFTFPLSDPVKSRPSTSKIGNSQEIIFLRPDPDNQTLVNCMGNKSTNQPD